MIDDFDLIDWRETDTDVAPKALIAAVCLTAVLLIAGGFWWGR